MESTVLDRPPRSLPGAVRIVVRSGSRVGHVCSKAVGMTVIAAALALWLHPAWRAAFAQKIVPLVDAHARSSAQGAAAPSAALATPASTLGGPLAAASLPNAQASAPAMPVFSYQPDMNLLQSALASPQGIALRRVDLMRHDSRTASLTSEQRRVAAFISQRYRVAQAPIQKLVSAAYTTGQQVGLDPLLLLAVMAVESSFNPYAQSGVGALGLMQVMADIHRDKFADFGGTQAALDPLANLRVGALVLKNYVAQTGSLAGGLKRYVGATTPTDGGYGAKVLAERSRLRMAANSGARAPTEVPDLPGSSSGAILASAKTDASDAHAMALPNAHNGSGVTPTNHHHTTLERHDNPVGPDASQTQVAIDAA